MNLLQELQGQGFIFNTNVPTIKCKVFEDNKSCIEIATNHRTRPRTKHLSVRLHHFRSHIASKTISIDTSLWTFSPNHYLVINLLTLLSTNGLVSFILGREEVRDFSPFQSLVQPTTQYSFHFSYLFIQIKNLDRCYQSRSQRLHRQLKSIKRLPCNVDNHLFHLHKILITTLSLNLNQSFSHCGCNSEQKALQTYVDFQRKPHGTHCFERILNLQQHG